MMILDTDIFVWHFRGNRNATEILNQVEQIHISMMSYLELMQGVRNKREAQMVRRLLLDLDCKTLPLTENIGYRAAIYVEDYALSHGIRAGDAIIAATAIENGMPLYSSNEKHFKVIPGLDLQVFHPPNGR